MKHLSQYSEINKTKYIPGFGVGMPNQIKYCHTHGLEMLAPLDGYCSNCGRIIRDDSDEYIYECNWCHKSFLE